MIHLKYLNQYLLILIIFTIISPLTSCTSDQTQELPKKGTFPKVKLVNYDGSDFYMKDLEGKIVVVSYIYTNCPDICHMISKKIDKFKSQLDTETLENTVFVSISFDPTRDTPDVLKEHIKMMDLDLENWYFVTGRRDLVYDTLEVAGINPLPDEIKSPDSYTLNHRDRITLVDRSGQLRKHYKGTGFDHDELRKDIKTLM